MKTAAKVVTQTPIKELGREDGFATTSRVRCLTADDIASLLRVGPVQFVVADVGVPLRWIPLSHCYDYWKREVHPHLAAPDSRTSLDGFPDCYCYFASEWGLQDGASIILCERHH